MKKAKIYYIYHSGFVVKTENHFLIFDYYKEPIENQNRVLLSPENIKEMKNVYVFSSHSHADHYNPKILEWEKYNDNIQYILSDDIKTDKDKSNYNFMGEGDEKVFQDIYVKAYGSTDIGISFLVKVDGLTIFHAGDLNWWHWKEDSLDEQTLAESLFKAHIEKIKEEKPIDIAFFPVDPRLCGDYYIGGEYFAKNIQPWVLIPMHFGDDVDITKQFVNRMNKINIKAALINYPGQEIIY
ncbi:MBL fold metallo-hydrolase [Clostridium estertheticum]|uniref:MBL fold metallo-hydrolase n=1 Tax=Clostridium estertheticum TaxID=238834 RepID=A0A5N7IY96_9CLOT|nr:MBL fold metallo-hydrolase [Clostridium estertheticum]MPQ30794.1 MBL fold metallo-hydrolase [Clostridium estertheticum]MPQ61470.1 MBL fold metallo-hydrolase [Clostridium estertheticum]